MRLPEDSRSRADETRAEESSSAASARNQTYDLDNEIIDLACGSKGADMKVILGLGCRGR